MNGGMAALLLQSAAGLAVVLGLFALLVRLMRRLPLAASARGGIRITARASLDGRHSLVEIERDGRRYLVALSQAGALQLDPAMSLPAAAPEPSENRHPADGANA